MANLASAGADADEPAAAAEEAASFVLNLCSSTTPMALAQTELPELKRFTFFVSRRFEEGRERFRLHMGFFASQAEAEEWLSVVRDIYPGAWAGEAPGKKLRARAAAVAAAQAQHAAGPQKSAAPAAARAGAPALPAVAKVVSAPPAARPEIPKVIPTLHPPSSPSPKAPAAAATAVRTVPAQAAKAAPQPLPKRPPVGPAASKPAAAATAAARGAAQHSPALRPIPAARPAAATALPAQSRTAAQAAAGARAAVKAAPVKPAAPPLPAAPARPTAAMKPVPPAAARAAQQPARKPVFANSNVKEVLAALDGPEDATGETRLMTAPTGFGDTADDSSLTDTQVLRFLEARRSDEGAPRGQATAQADVADASGISLLKPDDTGTRRALKEAVSHNDPVSFAVQLQWSVQPVQLDKVPPLAIFSAYTLYSVEGSRDGRRWYGLRLGFFNDAISAKQVAYYVRSEFASVAVVPVSSQERERATEDQQRFAGAGAPRERGGPAGLRRQSEDNEFKLIDSDQAPVAAAPQAPAASPSPARAAPQPAAARTVRKGTGKVSARERRTPQTLEETLEILGANELAIDNGGDGSLSDTGVRHLRVEFQKNTPFSRLLERLSERVKKS